MPTATKLQELGKSNHLAPQLAPKLQATMLKLRSREKFYRSTVVKLPQSIIITARPDVGGRWKWVGSQDLTKRIVQCSVVPERKVESCSGNQSFKSVANNRVAIREQGTLVDRGRRGVVLAPWKSAVGGELRSNCFVLQRQQRQ